MKKLAGLMALLMSLSCFTGCQEFVNGLLGGGNTSDSVAGTTEESMDVLGEQEAVTLKKGKDFQQLNILALTMLRKKNKEL